MANYIFISRQLKPQSFAQRLLRQQIEENAIIEVNNLLATRNIREITSDDLSVIDNRYGTHLKYDFALNLEEFYASYLNYCLMDKRLDENECLNLQHLKQLFHIRDKTIEFLHEKIGGAVYKNAYEEIVSDGKIDSEEATFLENLNNTLCLSKEFAEKISFEVRNGLMNEKLSIATKDFRLSPEEEKELELIASNLNMRILKDGRTGKVLQQMKRYWALENLEVPNISIETPLVKGETCHYETDAQWKKVNGRNWSTSRFSSNVADGQEIPVKTAYAGHYLELIDTGSIYATNKRIIFEGRDNRTSIKFEKILRLKLYTDALEIVRETGKNPIIFCNAPGELGILIERLRKVI